MSTLPQPLGPRVSRYLQHRLTLKKVCVSVSPVILYLLSLLTQFSYGTLDQGGVYSSSIQKAKATGDPDTQITFGVKGKDLPSSGSGTSTEGPDPAQAAKDRHSKRDERGIVMPHNHILYGEA